MKTSTLKTVCLIFAVLLLMAVRSTATAASGPAPPVLVAPAPGAVLPQLQSGVWVFEWEPVRKAKQYEIHIIGANASIPLADSITTSTRYVIPQSGGYIVGRHLQGWTWRVRTQDGKGRWGNWSEGRRFDVTPMTGSQVLPSFPAAYFIKGELRDAAGNLVPGAPVCIAQGGYRTCIPTDAGGRFSMQVNGEGRYEVIPGQIPKRPRTDMFSPHDAYPAVSKGREVILDSTTRDVSVVLTLPENNPELPLKIVDGQTQLPVELIILQTCYAGQLLQCGGEFFRSDTGEYRIHVPSQDFNLSVRSPDYEEWASFDNKGMKSGTKTVRIEMRRLPDAENEALHESEKRAGFHLPAPVQLAPAENEKIIRTPRVTTLHWQKVEGASRYEVEVDYCRNSPDNPYRCVQPTPYIFVFPALGKSPLPNTTEDTSLTFNFVGAQPGRWRVWAVDRYGRKGFKSPWRVFIYVR